MSSPLQPDPIAVYRAFLVGRTAVTAICGTRIRTTLAGLDLPAVKLTLLPANGYPQWSEPEIQVDVYGNDEGLTALLARTIAAQTQAMGQTAYTGAKVAGASCRGPWQTADDLQGEFSFMLVVTFLLTA